MRPTYRTDPWAVFGCSQKRLVTCWLLAFGAAAPHAAPAQPVSPSDQLAKTSDTRPGQSGSRYAPIQPRNDEGQVPELQMFVGESRVFPAPGVARIAVGNGALLTAAALDGQEVILFANGVGTSSLFIWNGDGRHQRLKINIVPGDAARHAREIAGLLSAIPNARATAIGANIIVEGDELSDADIARIEALAKRYPQLVNFTNPVGWERMVMMDVKVVEFPVTALRGLGLKWGSTGGAAIGAVWAPARRGHGGPYQVNINTGPDNAPPITGIDGGPVIVPESLNAIAFLNLGLNAQLNLLAQEGKAAVLAEPQLSARSGSKASFLAGGEIPYAVSTTEGIRVLFKPYGVKLEIAPRVDHNGVIRASIHSEVSAVDRSLTTAGGPALLTRRTETEFNVRDGETIVLSGLLQRDVSTDIDKVPLLGDLPVLGALFRSERFQNKETELVVFVTPHVVSAQSSSVRDRVARTTERLEQRLGPSPYLSDPLQPGTRYEQPDPGRPTSGNPPHASSEATEARAVRLGDAAPQAKDEQPAVSRVAEVGTTRASAEADHGALLVVVADEVALHADPARSAAVLLVLHRGSMARLGTAALHADGVRTWRKVVVGEMEGWVPAEDVQPAGRSPATQRPPPVEVDGHAKETAVPYRSPPDARQGSSALPLTLAHVPTSKAAARYEVLLDRLPMHATPDVNADVVARLLAGDVVVALALPSRGPWRAVQFSAAPSSERGWVAAQWLRPLGPGSRDTKP